MRSKRGYGQFCPVARASELVAVRWMPLVLRELLAGSRRFAELRRGIPLITPAMLSKRLRELVDAGVVERSASGGSEPPTEYRLTHAGEELKPVIDALGLWGQRWAPQQLGRDEVDPELLMWITRRRLRCDALPCARAVLLFEFPDVPIAVRRFWLVIDRGEVDLCLRSPGHEVDLSIVTGIRTLVAVYLGEVDPADAVRSSAIVLRGSRALQRTFPAWCARSAFAAAALRRPARPPGRVRPAIAAARDDRPRAEAASATPGSGR
jgi:DNA-binding HxlR family transcriptional regulator